MVQVTLNKFDDYFENAVEFFTLFGNGELNGDTLIVNYFGTIYEIKDVSFLTLDNKISEFVGDNLGIIWFPNNLEDLVEHIFENLTASNELSTVFGFYMFDDLFEFSIEETQPQIIKICIIEALYNTFEKHFIKI